MDPLINVRAILAFPQIEKSERPSYTFILNPFEIYSSNLIKKWYKVYQLIKNDTEFDIAF